MTLVADFNSSVNVPFQRMRQQQLDGALQEGVVGATDLKVVQRGAGANQSVDVGAGFAWVQIDTGTRNGMGHVTNDATANVTVTASDATNPRIDQIILRWNDTSIPTGSGNVPTLAVLSGTATAGATLDNRTGAAALPNDCLRLADILVPATSTSVTTANIRDRRPWARGAFFTITRTAADYTVSSATAAAIDGTNLAPRIECSGVPLRVALHGSLINAVPTSTHLYIRLLVDGAAVDERQTAFLATAVAQRFPTPSPWLITPAVGSHVISFDWRSTAGTTAVTLLANATNPLVAAFEEIVRPNASNT